MNLVFPRSPSLTFEFGAGADRGLSRRLRSSNTFLTVGCGYIAVIWICTAVTCNSSAVTARLPCGYLDRTVTCIAHKRFSRHSLPQSTQRHHLLGNAPSLCFDNALDPLRLALAQTFDIIVLLDEIRTALESSSVLLTRFGPTLLWCRLCQKCAHPSNRRLV